MAINIQTSTQYHGVVDIASGTYTSAINKDQIPLLWATKPLASDFGIGQAWFSDIGSMGYSDGVSWHDVSPTANTNEPTIALARYRAIPNNVARKIAWVGDSTTENMFLASIGGFAHILGGNATTDYSAVAFGYPAAPFYNVTHYNFGSSGNSCANFLNDVVAGKSTADVAAVSPDLIVFCYGINDVRLGGTTKDQLKSLITSSILKLQDAIPGADIIMRMPNSLLYDSANTNSYIDAPTSLAKVQGYSDILREAYRELNSAFSNTYLLDTQRGTTQIFTEKCNTAAGLYMSSATDSLHPSAQAYAATIREVILAITDSYPNRYAKFDYGVKPLLPPITIAEAAHAAAVNATDPYLIMPRVCEDAAMYTLIFEGLYDVGATSSYMDISSNIEGINASASVGLIAANDIIVQYGVNTTTPGPAGESIEAGVAAWKYTTLNAVTHNNHIRLLSVPAGYPLTQYHPNVVRVYRKI